MNVKVLVVVLVGLVVAVALVLFYGALRPAGEPDAARGGVEGGLGWIAPSPTLTFEDVATASCADPAIQGFTIPANGVCRVRVPNPAGIVLCTDDAPSVEVRTNGEDYPPQRVDAEKLSCEKPGRIPFYDTETRLVMRCVGLATCAVRVVPPAG